MMKTTRLLIVTISFFMISGCVGTAVRAMTWSNDPTPFLVVMRDDGECSVVWGDLLIDANQYSRAVSQLEKPPTVDCLTTDGYYSNNPSARATLLYSRPGDLDLSMPKHTRSGPQIIDESELVARTEEDYLKWPLGLSLAGVRLGQSFFCPNIPVEITSLTMVFNAGVDHDIHVFVGEGIRQCNFIF